MRSPVQKLEKTLNTVYKQLYGEEGIKVEVDYPNMSVSITTPKGSEIQLFLGESLQIKGRVKVEEDEFAKIVVEHTVKTFVAMKSLYISLSLINPN